MVRVGLDRIDDGRGVSLHGPPGTGKTACIALIAREVLGPLDRKARAQVEPTPMPGQAIYSSADLFDGLHAGDQDDCASLERLWLLCIDDLGTEYGSEFVFTRFQALLDKRYRDCKLTIIASNLTPGDLAARPGWERIADRLVEMNETILVPGESMRRARPRHEA